jgi:hypothetical protein
MAPIGNDAGTAAGRVRKTIRRPEAPKQKRRPGRPSKYKPEFAERVTDYCLLGATNEELARIFKVRDTTIPEWIDRYPEFAEAIKKGREIADANVAKALYRRAIGWTQPAVKIATKIEVLPDGTEVKSEHIVPYTEHFPPDTAAAFIWLKNRRPDLWRDRKEVSSTSKAKVDERGRYELSPEARQILDETLAELGKGNTTGNGGAANGATKY